MIGEAKKYGVRLILSLVNNYNDFGGRPQYVEWAKSRGVPVNDDDDFYTNPVIKGYYKAHVKVRQTLKSKLARENPYLTGKKNKLEKTLSPFLY